MVIIVFVDKFYQLDVPLNVTVKKIIEQFMSLIEEKVFFLGKNVYNKFRKRRYYSKYNYYEKYFQYLWSS